MQLCGVLSLMQTLHLTNVIIEIHVILLFTSHNTNIAYHITEVLIFSAHKFMVMGNSKNSHVFNVAIYSNHENHENLMLVKYTCLQYLATVS